MPLKAIVSRLHQDLKLLSKSKSLASCADKDRIEDLSYIKLGCYLSNTSVDDHISLAGMDLQYCLVLPQSSYDPGTADITALSTPGTPKKRHILLSKKIDPSVNGASDDDVVVSPPEQASTPQAVTPNDESSIWFTLL